MAILAIVLTVLTIVCMVLIWVGFDTGHEEISLVGFILAVVFGIFAIVLDVGFVYLSTSPYRPGYQEMLKRVEASGEYDEQLNKDIYEWNVLCDWYGYEKYMIEYKKGE